MSLTLAGTKRALAPNLTASFGASGGVMPYTYSVDGRGSINSSTGLYTAPSTVNTTTPYFDTVTVTDATGATAFNTIICGNPWMLLLEIIQSTLGLAKEMIWFENQKFFEPTNALTGMWVVLMFPNLKTYASGLHPAGAVVPPSLNPYGTPTVSGPGWDQTESWANFSGPVDINLFSRDLSALNLKEQVIRVLNGPYSRFQQQANSFYIARIPHATNDLSTQDGSAIPWRFVISVEMQYATSKVFGSDYYDQIPVPQIVTNV